MKIACLLIFQSFALLSAQLLSFAVAWNMLSWYDSPFLMTLCTASAYSFQFLFLPWIGGWVDRAHRLKLAAKGDAVYVGAALLLYLSIAFARQWKYGMIVFPAFTALCGLARAIQTSAFQSFLADVAKGGQRSKLFARWNSVTSVTGMVAPPLSAALMNIVTIKGFIVTAVLAVSAAVVNALLIARGIPMHRVESGSSRSSARQNLATTWSLVCRSPFLMLILLSAFAINFVEAPILSLTPVLVKIDWHMNVTQLAAAQALMTAGLLSSSALQSVYAIKMRTEHCVALSIVLLVVSLAMVGGVPNAAPGFLYAGMFVYGFSTMLFNVPAMAMIADETPESMRGRVMAGVNIAGGASMPLGLLIFGVVAEYSSARLVTWLGVAIFSAVGAYFIFNVSATRGGEMEKNVDV